MRDCRTQGTLAAQGRLQGRFVDELRNPAVWIGAIAGVLDRLAPFIAEKDIGRFPGYMNIVKEAAATEAAKGSGDADLVDSEVVERLWRASAGSAHGKRWPSLEVQIVDPGKEIAPGLLETDRVPDPVAITKILKFANSVLTYGVLRFADPGYEPQVAKVMGAAQEGLAAVIPRRSDL
jgi:hypothetical protein